MFHVERRRVCNRRVACFTWNVGSRGGILRILAALFLCILFILLTGGTEGGGQAIGKTGQPPPLKTRRIPPPRETKAIAGVSRPKGGGKLPETLGGGLSGFLQCLTDERRCANSPPRADVPRETCNTAITDFPTFHVEHATRRLQT